MPLVSQAYKYAGQSKPKWRLRGERENGITLRTLFNHRESGKGEGCLLMEYSWHCIYIF